MTILHRRISRKTASAYAVLYRKARPVVVSLMPGDILEFRESGRRTRFQLPIETAFRYAVRLAANAKKVRK